MGDEHEDPLATNTRAQEAATQSMSAEVEQAHGTVHSPAGLADIKKEHDAEIEQARVHSHAELAERKKEHDAETEQARDLMQERERDPTGQQQHTKTLMTRHKPMTRGKAYRVRRDCRG